VAKRGLTPKQATFAEEYLVDMNATAAAKRAGYSARTAEWQGPQLLGKPHVQERIQSAMRERSARTGITQDRVLQEIARVAFADPRSVMSWGPDGVVLCRSETLTDDQAAIVSEVSQTVNESGGSIRLKLNDKLDALEKLAKHVGLYTNAPPMDEERKNIVFYLPANGR